MTKLLAGLLFVFVLHCAALAQDFVPKLQIDQKQLINEALAKVLDHDPLLKAGDLEVIGLNYQFQPTEGTTLACGPDGCHWVAAAPFFESLSVSFRIKSSERKAIIDGKEVLLSDSISATFPQPRIPQWYFGKGTVTAPTGN